MDNEIKTKYGKIMVDGSRYLVNNIVPSGTSDEQGVVYLPYILAEHSEESLKEYDEFMKEYDRLHALCPKCGFHGHYTTLVCYCLYVDKKDEYKDENRCKCTRCGDVHITHDRVEKFETEK